jgi:NTE family protein
VKGAKEKPRNYKELVENMGLTDGGIYDNMGTEAVWKSHETLLVSDGGATFDPDWDKALKGILWRLPRYADVAGRQSQAIRRRWLISNFILGEIKGTYWGIGSSTDKYVDVPAVKTQGYDAQLVDNYVSEVRTDFDAFTKGEMAVLENHTAIGSIQRRLRQLFLRATRLRRSVIKKSRRCHQLCGSAVLDAKARVAPRTLTLESLIKT